MRVENEVRVIDVYVQDLIDIGGLVFAGWARSKPVRPSTIGREEEVPDEHEASERRHHSELQSKPNEVTKKKKAWQPSQRGTQENRRQKRSLIMPYHTGLLATTASEGEAEAGNTGQPRVRRGPYQCRAQTTASSVERCQSTNNQCW